MYLAKSIAASGIRNQQYRIDQIASNVANANTVGYKNARIDFKDSLYTYGLNPSRPRTPEGNQQKGHGLMLNAVTRDFKPGVLQRTERPLDFSIEGEGFFSLSDASGDLVYTRNGSFHLSVENGTTFLVNGEGLYVLDQNGERITIPAEVTTIGVAADGTLEFRMGDNIVGGAQMGIFTFRNLKGLSSEGGGNFAATDASGERLAATGTTVRQGVLEGSNVNLATEMTLLIRTQRAFQLSSRALSTADEMEGIANNMRR